MIVNYSIHIVSVCVDVKDVFCRPPGCRRHVLPFFRRLSLFRHVPLYVTLDNVAVIISCDCCLPLDTLMSASYRQVFRHHLHRHQHSL